MGRKAVDPEGGSMRPPHKHNCQGSAVAHLYYKQMGEESVESGRESA